MANNKYNFSFSERYFHKLTLNQKKEVKDSGMSLSDFMETFKQPYWCSYPYALEGDFGCWALCSFTKNSISRDSCKNCDACLL